MASILWEFINPFYMNKLFLLRQSCRKDHYLWTPKEGTKGCVRLLLLNSWFARCCDFSVLNPSKNSRTTENRMDGCFLAHHGALHLRDNVKVWTKTNRVGFFLFVCFLFYSDYVSVWVFKQSKGWTCAISVAEVPCNLNGWEHFLGTNNKETP